MGMMAEYLKLVFESTYELASEILLSQKGQALQEQSFRSAFGLQVGEEVERTPTAHEDFLANKLFRPLVEILAQRVPTWAVDRVVIIESPYGVISTCRKFGL